MKALLAACLFSTLTSSAIADKAPVAAMTPVERCEGFGIAITRVSTVDLTPAMPPRLGNDADTRPCASYLSTGNIAKKRRELRT